MTICEAFSIGVNTLKLSIETSFLKPDIQNIETKDVNFIIYIEIPVQHSKLVTKLYFYLEKNLNERTTELNNLTTNN